MAPSVGSINLPENGYRDPRRCHMRQASMPEVVLLGCVLSTAAACFGYFGDGDGAAGGEDPSAAARDSNPEPTALEPAPGGMRRLTAQQYVNSLGDLVGAPMNPVIDVDRFSFDFSTIGASSVVSSQQAVEQYRQAADDAAHQLFTGKTDPHLALFEPHELRRWALAHGGLQKFNKGLRG